MKQLRSDISDEVLLFLAEFIDSSDAMPHRVPQEAAFRGLYFLSNLLKSTIMDNREFQVLHGPLQRARRVYDSYSGYLDGSVDGGEVSQVLRGFTKDYVSYCAGMGINLEDQERVLNNSGDYAMRNQRFEWI